MAAAGDCRVGAKLVFAHCSTTPILELAGHLVQSRLELGRAGSEAIALGAGLLAALDDLSEFLVYGGSRLLGCA